MRGVQNKGVQGTLMPGGHRVWCGCRPNGASSRPDPECEICWGSRKPIWECDFCGGLHDYLPFQCDQAP